MRNLNLFTGKFDISLSEAMRRIDQSKTKILFLVDDYGKLISSLTDGDIRRFLLSGGKLNAPAVNASNRNPKTALTLAEAKSLYDSKSLFVIPIIDEKGIIIDVYDGEHARAVKRPQLNIPVVINAGGKGTRLNPFTKVLPKPLIPVGEVPIIELIMEQYQSYGCNDFSIIVNYKRELIKAYFAENKDRYNITWYDENKPLGTAGGLSFLRGKISSTFFFSNCDSLLTADYDSMMNFHRQNRSIITMICADKNITVPYGIVETGIDSEIKDMKEKPLISFIINTGIYIVEPEVLEDISEDVFIDFPDVIKLELQKGSKVSAFSVSEDDWLDMGQLSELEKMRKRLYGE